MSEQSKNKYYGAPPKPEDGREAMRQLGEVLFGSDWKQPLATALGLSRGYVSLMDSGRKAVTPEIIERLRAFASERVAEEEASHAVKLVVLKRMSATIKPSPKKD